MSITMGVLLLLFAVGHPANAASIPGGREAWCNLLKLPTLHYNQSVAWD